MEAFLRLLDVVLSPAAAPFTETQKISYAVESRWQGEKAECRTTTTLLCQGCETHTHKVPDSANSILPHCGAGCGQSDNPGSADAGYDVCRLHPQPAACRASQSSHPKLPPFPNARTHGHAPTRTVPWGCGPAPLLTGAVGGHVVVGVLAVVLDGCSIGGQVVPGGEGDKAMLQLQRRFAVSN